MAILTQSGRAAIAQSVKDQVIHIAWGQGQLEAGHDNFNPEDPMQKNDANASDPSTKKGIFVDPFFDDDMRDQGIEQTGAIVDKCLTLPMRSEVQDLAKDQRDAGPT